MLSKFFHSFSSKEQVSFNFMAVATVHSDFGAQENKICYCFHFFLFCLPPQTPTLPSCISFSLGWFWSPPPIWYLPIYIHISSGNLSTRSNLMNLSPPLYNHKGFDLSHTWTVFIFSGVISPLTSSSILGTYQPGKFILQCPIFLPFHIVHGVLEAGILKCFAIPFSSGPHIVRTLHHDPPILGGPTQHSS